MATPTDSPPGSADPERRQGALARRAVPDLSPPEDGDEKAVKESQRVANLQDLEEQAERSRIGRREDFRQVFHCALIAGSILFFLIIMVAGASWAWHLLTPESMHFLSAAAIERIQSTFLTGVVSGVLSVAVKQRYFD